MLKWLGNYFFLSHIGRSLKSFLLVKLFSRNYLLIVLVVFIFLFVGSWSYFVFFYTAHYPALMVIDGRSEVASVTVVDAQRMDFRIGPARVRIDDSFEGCVAGAVFKPSLGSVVRFERAGRGSLIVAIDPPQGGLDPQPSAWQLGENGPEAPFIEAVVEFAHESSDCSADEEQSFILAGQIAIGTELAPAIPHRPLVLLSASVRTYGRAAATVGFLPLDWGPMQPNALYAADRIDLPPGTRIRQVAGSEAAIRNAPTGGDTYHAYAAGILRVDLANDATAGFRLALTANTRSIDLFLPAPRWTDGNTSENTMGEPDRLYFSRGAHILDDPNIGWLAMISGAIFAALLAILAIVWSSWQKPGRQNDP